MNFEEKYGVVIKQIDNIIKNDRDHSSLKKYIEGYKIEKVMQEREEKRIEESFLQYGSVDKSVLNQRNQIVGLAEIREHEKFYTKAKYEKIAQREIKRMKERERCNEYNCRIENEMKMNRKRVENFELKKKEDDQKDQKNILSFSNNLKKKEFGDFVNKINIERIQNNKMVPSHQRNHKQALDKRIPKEKEAIRDKVSYSQQNKKKIVFQLKKINKERESSKEKRELKSLPESKAIENPTRITQKDYIKEGLKFAKRNKGNKLNVLSESKKFDSQDDFVNNIETLKYKAKKFEQLARNQEQLIKFNGGPKNNLKASEKASNYLFDSIIAKISLLKQMSSE